MDECVEYVARAETEPGGVFAHQSEHASFQIVTSKATLRLSHGRLVDKMRSTYRYPWNGCRYSKFPKRRNIYVMVTVHNLYSFIPSNCDISRRTASLLGLHVVLVHGFSPQAPPGGHARSQRHVRPPGPPDLANELRRRPQPGDVRRGGRRWGRSIWRRLRFEICFSCIQPRIQHHRLSLPPQKYITWPQVSLDATGILGETRVPILDDSGKAIMQGMGAIRGFQEECKWLQVWLSTNMLGGVQSSSHSSYFPIEALLVRTFFLGPQGCSCLTHTESSRESVRFQPVVRRSSGFSLQPGNRLNTIRSQLSGNRERPCSVRWNGCEAHVHQILTLVRKQAACALGWVPTSIDNMECAQH